MLNEDCDSQLRTISKKNNETVIKFFFPADIHMKNFWKKREILSSDIHITELDILNNKEKRNFIIRHEESDFSVFFKYLSF